MEHRSLAAVLQSLGYLVKQVREGGPKPDFKVLRAMLYYIDVVPERLHHPKEDRYLLKRLHRRTDEANATLESLEAQHVRGGELIRDLTQALQHWEQGGDGHFAEFARQADAYAEFTGSTCAWGRTSCSRSPSAS